MARQNNTKMLPEIMKNQSKFWMVHPLDASNSFLAPTGLTRVEITKRITRAADIKNTGLCISMPHFLMLSCPTL